MSRMDLRSRWAVGLFGLGVLACVVPSGAQVKRGRNYKPLQPAANIKVIVEKAANGKPISNAAVIFRAEREGKQEGSLEVKTNSNGEALIDVIEVGSHVSVQVIAEGFATNSAEFDVPTENKDFTIRMEKPKAQVSVYENNDGRASQRVPGVQEPRHVVQPPKSNTAVKPAAQPGSGKPISPNDPAYQLGAKPTDTAPDATSPTTGSPDSSNSPVKTNPSAAGTPSQNLPGTVSTPKDAPKPYTVPPASNPQ